MFRHLLNNQDLQIRVTFLKFSDKLDKYDYFQLLEVVGCGSETQLQVGEQNNRKGVEG